MQDRNDDPKARVRALVGRQQYTALLERALDRPREHGTRVIEVVGEPGIGKSRMLEALRAEAARRCWVLLAGHATESERPFPFGVRHLGHTDRGLAGGGVLGAVVGPRSACCHAWPN